MVRVVRDGEVVARLGAGEFFGELSVLDRLPRNATVSAEAPTSCLALASWDFERILLEQPALTLTILRGVAARPGPRPTRTATRSRDTDGRAGAVRDADVPVLRHRGFDAPARQPRAEAYTRVLERQAAIMRAAIAKHGGREEGTEGDSFFVVFDGALEAVNAAVDVQRASPPSPGRRGWTSRSGWGSTRVRRRTSAAGLVGIDVNRAARIAAAAHGGQVVVSDAVRSLVVADLDAGVSLRGARQPPAEGPARAAAAVPGRRRRPAAGVPAAPVAGRSPQQPPDPAHLLRRAGAGARRGRRAARAEPPGHAHRPGRHGQDAARSSRSPRTRPSATRTACSSSPRDGPRARARRIQDRLGDRARGERQPDGRCRPPRVARRQAGPRGPRQLRAGRGRRTRRRRPPPRRPGAVRAHHLPARLRVSGEQEYPVPGLPTPPDLSQLSSLELASLQPPSARSMPRRCRPTSPSSCSSRGRPRCGRTSGSRTRTRPMWRRSSRASMGCLGHRAGGGPRKLFSPRPSGPGWRTSSRCSRRCPRSAGAPADPPRCDRLELRPARRGERLLLDRLSIFEGGVDLAAAEAVCGPGSSSAWRSSTGSLRSPSRASSARSTARASRASRSSRPSVPRRGTAREPQRDRGCRRSPCAAWFLALAQRIAPELAGGEQRQRLDQLELEHDNIRACWTGRRPRAMRGSRSGWPRRLAVLAEAGSPLRAQAPDPYGGSAMAAR